MEKVNLLVDKDGNMVTFMRFWKGKLDSIDTVSLDMFEDIDRYAEIRNYKVLYF